MANARWKISGLPAEPPCDLAPVITLQFASEPYLLGWQDAGWLDGRYKAAKH